MQNFYDKGPVGGGSRGIVQEGRIPAGRPTAPYLRVCDPKGIEIPFPKIGRIGLWMEGGWRVGGGDRFLPNHLPRLFGGQIRDGRRHKYRPIPVPPHLADSSAAYPAAFPTTFAVP